MSSAAIFSRAGSGDGLPPTPASALRGAVILPRYDWADAPVVNAMLGHRPAAPVGAADTPSIATDLLDAACWMVCACGLAYGAVRVLIPGLTA